ncbi:E3 ubiquitin-protein ligase UBR1 KNAG_0H02590 [Huiozyma naganishii CBS 8797]|uniref:E3 ubiquitin-protein ligase n=1 Tax=Huiozyma naganishii (strain ATCC MYA-139 / BCRC 22969 / CBS 8797 / KCTC 17520 / NBRC 10181 / NCYC 3082 / Yp74L-3) TaxID=1071383 RepID=J7S8P8_HUIN7|nr:hypothetical protein KNAG_0H02590 [Kazachstania naganishii CBS 8797]CCK71674.1 hypothetical protein KNAG_0H02590 [Kazachstania naganishii CBS 8797]
MDTTQLKGHVRSTLLGIHELEHFKNIRGPGDRTDMDHSLKALVYKYLYFAISDQGAQLPKLFPGRSDFPVSFDQALDVNYKEDYYKVSSQTVSKSKQFRHKGRNCGRKFRLGEPLYRCQECGYDDTCVLCINCFNPKDHEGHHIYTDICNDFTSGICDCGDEEAWLSPLHCKAEEDGEDEIMDSDDAEFDEEIIESVLMEIFDYIIDLFNQNFEPLPTFTKEITFKLREFVQKENKSQIDELLNDVAYKNERIATPEAPSNYTVMIYNDEYHNYSQASMALRQGVPDNIHTDLLTSRIDSEGRAMLKCAEDISSLMDGYFAVQTNGLSATMTSWTEYVHQETAKYLIFWCNHCLTIPNPDFQHAFRNALGKVLCDEYTKASVSINMTSSIEKYFAEKIPLSNPYRFLDVSLLNEKNGIPLGHHKRLAASSLDQISNTLNEYEQGTERTYFNSRLQYILFFDNRYWKKLRKELQNLIIPTLSSSIIYKPIFCENVVQIFNHISRSITFMDREPQLTALRECIVQLFTCPTNAMMIFTHKNNYFTDIMWSIIDIFVDFCKLENGNLVWQRVQRTNPTKSFNISFKQALYTVEILLSKVDNPSIILQPAEFISIVTLCKFFNGAWKIKRKEGEHVLHEDQHFIPYLEFTTSVYSIIQTIDNSLTNHGCDERLLTNAIRLMNSFLSHKSLTYKLTNGSHEIVKFSVSSERVAFMNPILNFFFLLIEKVPLSKAYETIVYQDASPDQQQNNEAYNDAKDDFDFLKISDFALRSVVLCSQIDIGFWVRNGMSVLHQASYYKNNPELNSYSRDIHLNQLAFLWEFDDTPRVIYNMLDRWELLAWFNGEVSFKQTVYGDKISLMIQQFLSFVYQVLTERQFFQTFDSVSEKKMHQIKEAIIYNLYAKPLPYSKLLRLVPDYFTENSANFDAALSEVSNFIEPRGLADNGVFKLKEIFYSKIDPLKLLNLGNEFESSATIIKTHLAKGKKDEVTKVVLQPQLISPKHMDEGARNLGFFTKGPVFVKIVYKLLQTALDNKDGAYLNELLHLIHAIFKDDELLNGKDSLIECYINLPICSLLLAIINSKSETFSEHIVNKADYLLERMIIKKSPEIFESLITSFGSSCVEEYKSRKLNQGVNLEESEREKRRRLAKKHQAKMLAKFNNLQSKFMKENEDEFDGINDSVEVDGDIDMITGEKSIEVNEFTCSLCQDDKSEDVFVIPAYHDYSPIFRGCDITDPSQFAQPWKGFQNNAELAVNSSEHDVKSLQDDSSVNLRKVFVSCNHHIHHNCFRRYIQKKRFSSTAFICPLCQSFSNCILPIHSTSKVNTGLSVDSFLNEEISVTLLARTLKTLSAVDFKNLISIFDLVYSDCLSFNRDYRKTDGFKDQDTALVLAQFWANTISMLEISSRLDSKPHAEFLTGREQKYKTLGNILVCIILQCYTMGLPNLKFEPFTAENANAYNYNALFQFIVRECLFGGRPMRSVISEGLRVYAWQVTAQFLFAESDKDINEKYERASANGAKFFPINTEINSLLGQLLLRDDNRNLQDREKVCSMAYTSTLRHIVPTLRRCLIMLKVLHNVLEEDNTAVFTVKGVDVESTLKLEETMELPAYVDWMLGLMTSYDSFGDLLRNALRCNVDNDLNIAPMLRRLPHEHCGLVKLVDLSTYLNTYVTNTREIKLREENQYIKNAKNRLDFKICLTCGVKIYQRTDHHEMTRHLNKNCFKSFGVFLIPNTSEVCLILTNPPSHIFISAPYLNSHGETGRNAMKRGDLTTLSLKRYEHLNRLWINNEIPGYISRVMGDEFRVSILSNGFLFAFNRDPRIRRAPFAGRTTEDEDDDDGAMDDEDDEDDDAGAFGDYYAEDDRDNDVLDDERFIGGMGGPNGGAGGDVRDFFQIFENFRNVMGEAVEGEGEGDEEREPGINFTAPLIQLLGPPLRRAFNTNAGANVDSDADADADANTDPMQEEQPEDDDQGDRDGDQGDDSRTVF